MQNNAYILERTMEDYDGLKSELKEAGFEVEKEKGDNDIMVTVSRDRVSYFVPIIQKHFNEPFNYVDIKFPDMRLTVIVFRERIWEIDSAEINKEAQEWAISIGLPVKEADWPTFF